MYGYGRGPFDLRRLSADSHGRHPEISCKHEMYRIMSSKKGLTPDTQELLPAPASDGRGVHASGEKEVRWLASRGGAPRGSTPRGRTPPASTTTGWAAATTSWPTRTWAGRSPRSSPTSGRSPEQAGGS